MKCNKILEISPLYIRHFSQLYFFLQMSITDHLPSLNNWQVKVVPYFQKFNTKYQEEFFNWLLMTISILDYGGYFFYSPWHNDYEAFALFSSSYKINKIEMTPQIHTSFILVKLFENISRTYNRQCSLIFKYLEDLTVPWKDTYKNFKKSEILK